MMSKLVYGVGFNDKTRPVFVGGKMVKEYGLWGGMLRRCNVNGKLKHLGYFNTPQEAFAAYKPFKEALCKELALKWQSEIAPRLFTAMMKWEVKYETPTNF